VPALGSGTALAVSFKTLAAIDGKGWKDYGKAKFRPIAAHIRMRCNADANFAVGRSGSLFSGRV
jgi:hypothetical protein